jgi:hypothetical protein
VDVSTLSFNKIHIVPNCNSQAGLTYYIFWITDFHHHFGRSGGGNKKKLFVYTTFYFAGIANFLLLFSREEGIKPSPAAAIVW